MSRVDFGWTFKPTQGNPAVRRRDVLRTPESLACKRIMQRPLAFVSEQVVLAAGLRVCLSKFCKDDVTTLGVHRRACILPENHPQQLDSLDQQLLVSWVRFYRGQ